MNITRFNASINANASTFSALKIHTPPTQTSDKQAGETATPIRRHLLGTFIKGLKTRTSTGLRRLFGTKPNDQKINSAGSQPIVYTGQVTLPKGVGAMSPEGIKAVLSQLPPALITGSPIRKPLKNDSHFLGREITVTVPQNQHAYMDAARKTRYTDLVNPMLSMVKPRTFALSQGLLIASDTASNIQKASSDRMSFVPIMATQTGQEPACLLLPDATNPKIMTIMNLGNTGMSVNNSKPIPQGESIPVPGNLELPFNIRLGENQLRIEPAANAGNKSDAPVSIPFPNRLSLVDPERIAG